MAPTYTIISGITISIPKFINGSLEKTAKNITIKKDVPMMYASIIFFAVSTLSFLQKTQINPIIKTAGNNP